MTDKPTPTGPESSRATNEIRNGSAVDSPCWGRNWPVSTSVSSRILSRATPSSSRQGPMMRPSTRGTVAMIARRVRREADGRRIRSCSVRTPGSVKRVVFLSGLAITVLGAMILNDPAAVGPFNCGTALAPKRFVQGENAGRCDEQLRWRRWSGAGVLAAGVIALILPGGYRCLLTDD